MKIVIKEQVKFSKEETETLKAVDEALREIQCVNIIHCHNCPFYIKTDAKLDFKCAINIIHNIYTTYVLGNDNE